MNNTKSPLVLYIIAKFFCLTAGYCFFIRILSAGIWYNHLKTTDSGFLPEQTGKTENPMVPGFAVFQRR